MPSVSGGISFSQDDQSGVLLLEDLLRIKSPREFVQMLKEEERGHQKDFRTAQV